MGGGFGEWMVRWLHARRARAFAVPTRPRRRFALGSLVTRSGRGPGDLAELHHGCLSTFHVRDGVSLLAALETSPVGAHGRLVSGPKSTPRFTLPNTAV